MFPGRRLTLLDLSLTSPDLFTETNFQVHSDLFNSDHFPIKLVMNCRGTDNSSQVTFRYRYDWGKVSKQLNSDINSITSPSYEDFINVCKGSLSGSSRKIRILNRSGAP